MDLNQFFVHSSGEQLYYTIAGDEERMSSPWVIVEELGAGLCDGVLRHERGVDDLSDDAQQGRRAVQVAAPRATHGRWNTVR